MSECIHSFKEKATAIEDGLCPICQAQRIEELEELIKKIAKTSTVIEPVGLSRDAIVSIHNAQNKHIQKLIRQGRDALATKVMRQ
jgi:hypothetical protein